MILAQTESMFEWVNDDERFNTGTAIREVSRYIRAVEDRLRKVVKLQALTGEGARRFVQISVDDLRRVINAAQRACTQQFLRWSQRDEPAAQQIAALYDTAHRSLEFEDWTQLDGMAIIPDGDDWRKHLDQEQWVRLVRSLDTYERQLLIPSVQDLQVLQDNTAKKTSPPNCGSIFLRPVRPGPGWELTLGVLEGERVADKPTISANVMYYPLAMGTEAAFKEMKRKFLGGIDTKIRELRMQAQTLRALELPEGHPAIHPAEAPRDGGEQSAAE